MLLIYKKIQGLGAELVCLPFAVLTSALLQSRERQMKDAFLPTKNPFLSTSPSCRASFMMDAPWGGSWLQADLKKGSTCLQASSPGLRPSHISLKSRTFSSSRDIISVSFCFNISARWKQTKSVWRWKWGGKNQKNKAFFLSQKKNVWRVSSHLSSLWLCSLIVFCRLPSHWGSPRPRLSPCVDAESKKKKKRLKSEKGHLFNYYLFNVKVKFQLKHSNISKRCKHSLKSELKPASLTSEKLLNFPLIYDIFQTSFPPTEDLQKKRAPALSRGEPIHMHNSERRRARSSSFVLISCQWLDFSFVFRQKSGPGGEWDGVLNLLFLLPPFHSPPPNTPLPPLTAFE